MINTAFQPGLMAARFANNQPDPPHLGQRSAERDAASRSEPHKVQPVGETGYKWEVVPVREESKTGPTAEDLRAKFSRKA